MDWRDELAAALPEPIPDEPAGLRHDLVDEIADHLQCAFSRELLADGDDEAARSRVLARFGHVGKLLRQLWFDSLKERLVTQRITMLAAVVFAVASLAACGIAWSVAGRVQETNRAILAQSEEMNRKLLALLADRAEPAPAAPVSFDWNPLAVKLVSQDGKPLEGWNVDVKGHVHFDSEETSVTEQTDGEGLADFGMVRPGNYNGRVTSPWHEQVSFGVTVRPGQKTLRTIECPDSAPPEATVEYAFEAEGRETLAAANVGLVVGVQRTPREIDSKWWSSTGELLVLLTPDGGLRPLEGIYRQQPGELSLHRVGEPVADRRRSLPVGKYVVNSLKFVRLPEDDTFGEQTTVEDVEPPERVLQILEATERGMPAFGGFYSGRSGSAPTAADAQQLELPAGAEVTEWTIEVPRELATNALATLKAAELGTSETESGRSESTIAAVFLFYRADEDRDGALTAVEFDAQLGSSREPKPSENVEAEWPLGVESFVEVYRERRSNPFRGR